MLLEDGWRRVPWSAGDIISRNRGVRRRGGGLVGHARCLTITRVLLSLPIDVETVNGSHCNLHDDGSGLTTSDIQTYISVGRGRSAVAGGWAIATMAIAIRRCVTAVTVELRCGPWPGGGCRFS